jgi:hypothetical protein
MQESVSRCADSESREPRTLKGIRVQDGTPTTPRRVPTQTTKNPQEFAQELGTQAPKEAATLTARPAFFAAVLLALTIANPLPGKAQPKAPGAVGSYDSTYGMPEAMGLEEIARGVGNYRKRAVRTKAVVDGFGGGYYLLKGPGAVSVLGIPVPEMASEVNNFLGREVEIVGLVRPLPDKQACLPCEGTHCVPESKCEDPLLTALPDHQGSMPAQSITFWKIVDLTDFRGVLPGSQDYLTLESLVFSPGQFVNRKVRVLGQFRGRNLYGDLPARSERSPLDWVIKDGRYAVWVVGKEPKGSGWSLDVTLKSDTSRWLEVTGKPETIDGVVYLRAQGVHLAKGPPSPPPE